MTFNLKMVWLFAVLFFGCWMLYMITGSWVLFVMQWIFIAQEIRYALKSN